jgi:hypothetical protein
MPTAADAAPQTGERAEQRGEPARVLREEAGRHDARARPVDRRRGMFVLSDIDSHVDHMLSSLPAAAVEV